MIKQEDNTNKKQEDNTNENQELKSMRKVGRIDLIDPQGNIEDSKIITKFPYSSEIKFKKVGTYTFKLYDDEGNEIKGCYKMISRSLPVPTGHRHRVSYTLNNDENMRHCLAR